MTACDVPLVGPERSVESLCDTYWEQKAEYVEKYAERNRELEEAAKEDPLMGVLGALATTVEGMGDIVVMFDKFYEVAPDDIRPDVAAIRDAFKKVIDSTSESATDPLGSLFGNLVTSMSISGPWKRFGTYVADNCGES